jgi:hypothetical protein
MAARKLDLIRQGLNLVLAIAQPVTTYLCFARGTSYDDATRGGAGEPTIVPAGYAFIIWTLIYGGAVAYGVFQALPAQRENRLLRTVGFYTAGAFLGTCTWLVMARLGQTWLTVACIFWMLACLAAAFAPLARAGAALTRAERMFVLMPVSVFIGWVTVACFANTAAALKNQGLADAGLSETGWTVILLLAAGAVAARVTLASRGNAWYALTIVWALVGIVVANLVRVPNPVVAAVAGAMALVVSLALLRGRGTLSS